MFETIRNIWKVEDLRKKIIFTILMLLVYRLGAHIPVPGIQEEVIRSFIDKGALLGFFDTLSGKAFSNFSIFAMGIVPYINASIILQLLSIVIPKLEELGKQGAEGRRKISQYTRYLTVALALIQAIGLSYGLRSAMDTIGFKSYLIVAMTLTAGTAFVMWLGEQITDKGIGNGISLIIFAGIVVSFPNMIQRVYELVKTSTMNIFMGVLLVAIILIMIIGIVFVTEGQRKIPVQYAKRVVGRKMYGGQSTFIPLRVNQAGVIPVIFASSILMFPMTIAGFLPNNGFARVVSNALRTDGWLYPVLYTLLIVAFTYFYTAISFNPQDLSDNMKKYGGFIPGIRPGYPTTQYLTKVLNRITLIGGLFLAIISVIPNIIMSTTALQISFGGTSLLIAVGVALETMKQIESQLTMRHYKGFMK